MSLYLKYRPRIVDELDLSGVRKNLNEIIAANSVAHAYLLTGPRGAGKTSTARILARIVNCEKNDKKLGEPCNKCSRCLNILNGSSLDFVEIDAASNRGIDDIRELKDKVRLAPTELKYKVYIIDEVHMLTTEAFNALLKTLEEPPAHAIFVLCTTETHKVPETILSRCVHIQFSKATVEEMKRSFTRVIKGEGKKVADEAVEYLAKAVDGSFRDGVKILDVVLSKGDNVTLTQIEEQIVGAAGFNPQRLIEALLAKNSTEALAALADAGSRGVELGYLVVAVMKGLRDKLLSGAPVEATKLVFSLDDVARKLGTSPVPGLLIEMVIIEWCGRISDPTSGKPKVVKPIKDEEVSEVRVEPVGKDRDTQKSLADHHDVWRQLLAGLGGDSVSMGALLSKATPAHIQGDMLTIQVAYEFHREQIMSERVLAKLEKRVSELVGRQMRVVCEVGTKRGVSSAQSATPSQGDTIDEAIAIFT